MAPADFMMCIPCQTVIPVSAFCPECGKAVVKWCPQCNEWRLANYICATIDRKKHVAQTGWNHETKFCQDCGTSLTTTTAKDRPTKTLKLWWQEQPESSWSVVS